MASINRMGGGTATMTLATTYTCPAGKDERLEVRATNKSASPITVNYLVLDAASAVVGYVAFNAPLAVGDSIDVFPSGMKFKEGWQLQHRASAVTALDTVWAATPAD